LFFRVDYLAPNFCVWMNEFFIGNGFSTYTGLNETNVVFQIILNSYF